MTIPRATVKVLPSGPSIPASPPDKVFTFLGCSSGLGGDMVPRAYGTHQALIAAAGCGPGPKGAAYAAAATGAQFVYIDLPKTLRAATTSAVAFTGAGTSVVTVTGTPADSYEVAVVCTTGGTIGTSASIKYSLDGGKTYSAAIPIDTATSWVLGSTGLTVHFAAGTLVAGDAATFHTLPASAAILPLTTTRVAASTSQITVTGSPEDAYNLVFEVLTGCTIGVAGGTYRISLDGGGTDGTWTPETQLGTANSITVYDGEADSGLTIALAAGTLDAGDSAACTTTAPEWQASDALTALDALKASQLAWSMLVGVGTSDAAIAASLNARLESWATGTRFTRVVLSARDWGTHESLTTWDDRTNADVQDLVAERVFFGKGMATLTCPVTGRRNRRSASWPLVVELLKRGIEVDPGRVMDGPLSSDISIHDSDGNLVELDARIYPASYDSRYCVLRTYEDERGVYFTEGLTMGTSIQLIPLARVMDKASDIYRQVMAREVLKSFRRWTPRAKAPYKPGDVYEADAVKIEREVRSALEIAIVQSGQASGIQVRLNRTPVSLGGGKFRLLCSVKVFGLGYIAELEGEIGYVDPALDALLAA